MSRHSRSEMVLRCWQSFWVGRYQLGRDSTSFGIFNDVYFLVMASFRTRPHRRELRKLESTSNLDPYPEQPESSLVYLLGRHLEWPFITLYTGQGLWTHFGLIVTNHGLTCNPFSVSVMDKLHGMSPGVQVAHISMFLFFVVRSRSDITHKILYNPIGFAYNPSGMYVWSGRWEWLSSLVQHANREVSAVRTLRRRALL